MSGDFEPIDIDWAAADLVPGTYEGTVSKVESRKEGQPLRSSKGDLMLKITYRLEQGGFVVDYLMLSGKGAGMGLAKLRALGIPKGAKLAPDDLLGRRVGLVCTVEDYKGQQSLKAAKYLAIAGGETPTPPTIDDPSVPF